MNSNVSYSLGATLLLTLSVSGVQAKGAPRPNIIIILADDLGYSDIGCFCSEIATPNIDRLAAQGMKLTQMYNAARSCPSRAGLMTGMYHHKAGVGDLGLPAYQGYLNRQCMTLAEALKRAGYATCMSGKWHLGDARPGWPYNRGFDESFAFIGGATPFFKIERASDRDEDVKLVLNDRHYDPPQEGFYTTDAFSEYAAQYIESRPEQGAPFFLYVAYNAPHWPLQAWPEEIAKYRGMYDRGWDEMRRLRYERMLKSGIIGRESLLSPRDETVPAWDSLSDQDKGYWSELMAVYAAMIDRMDQGIGKIMAALKKRGIVNNTLILFISDNGGCMEQAERFADLSKYTGEMGSAESFLAYEAHWANVSNTPFRYFKHWMHEGGISTPFVARYPKMIKAGSRSAQPAHFIDMMPTVLELAGADYPDVYNGNMLKPIDGVSLVPLFKGRNKPLHDVIYFEHFGFKAVRQGRWKLVSTYPENQWALYDISVDRSELNDLSGRYPEKVDAMDAMYRTWAAASEVTDWEEVMKMRRRR